MQPTSGSAHGRRADRDGRGPLGVGRVSNPRASALPLFATTFLAFLSCATAPAGSGRAELPTVQVEHRPVRVALQTGARRATLSATGGWRILDSGGESTLLTAGPGDAWTVEPAGQRGMRATRSGEMPTAVRPGPWVVRATAAGALLVVDGKRYRGELVVHAGPDGLTVVNRLPLEDYLRGVVPLEIGTRATGDHDAVAAQAVAARSFSYAHLDRRATSDFDLRASVLDQVYGGASAETAVSDAAVRETAGLVLSYGGRVISAPYHAVCGGATAAATEVWQGEEDQPFLRSVSDRVPGTERFYCDLSPRFRWEQSFDGAALRATLDRYLKAYATVPAGGVGAVRAVEAEGRTPSGRVRTLAVSTDRGRYVLRGNEIRFVLRAPGGEILNSTYFSVESQRDAAGAVARLVLRGNGNGHGIGMCQWGAIGRARAGQDYRTILRTYYPGTTLATVD